MLKMTEDQLKQIADILDEAKDMTIATLRSDGFPQATTVTFVHEGTDIYFGCSRASQKAQNIERDNKVSCTVNPPYDDWKTIRSLSLAGRAEMVSDAEVTERIGRLFVEKFPQVMDYVDMPEVDMVFVKIDPCVVSILDYSKGFGHTELVEVSSTH